jgi:hypothetical protein
MKPPIRGLFLSFILFIFLLFFAVNITVMKILFYPDPLEKEPLSRVFRVLRDQRNIQWHNDPKLPHDIHFFWSYTKSKIKPDGITLGAKNVVNAGCWDITKEKVHKIFNNISVNPETHKGICVEKIDLQAKHKFHKLIECPAKRQKGYVYEKFFENMEDGFHVKYRVYYADGITHIIKKYTTQIFVTDIQKYEVIDKRTLFTAEQENELIRKCKSFGFNFGELDVVMDGKTPVVVDVNNVVGGGNVPMLTGTPIFKEIDNTLITFLKSWHDKSMSV